MSFVMPISFWGSIAYFQELALHQEVAFEVWEHFPKQTHRNRLKLVTPQGAQILTLPVVKPNGSKTLTKDIELVDDKQTRLKLWRAVVSSYASSPYFDHYETELSAFFLKPNLNLAEHTTEITSFIINTWEIKSKLNDTKEFLNADTLNRDYFEPVFNHSEYFYKQVEFNADQAFVKNVSILDLLCNLGPMGRKVIILNKTY